MKKSINQSSKRMSYQAKSVKLVSNIQIESLIFAVDLSCPVKSPECVVKQKVRILSEIFVFVRDIYIFHPFVQQLDSRTHCHRHKG